MSTAKASKGVLDLMRACGSLHEAGCAAEYVIAGEWTDPADRSAAERLIADFGMESAVTLLGDVQPPEKWERLRDADIFVLPSWAEGQPYAILEAMCFGLPVVASAVGAIPETVGDGEQGLLIEPHDVEGMHAALEQLITDEDLRRRMGTAARRRYEADFTLKRWEADMTQVLRLAAPGETTT